MNWRNGARSRSQNRNMRRGHLISALDGKDDSARRPFSWLVRRAGLATCAFAATTLFAGLAAEFHRWAEKPPMGWNSWDCFATTVTEAQAKAQADVMAEQLARYGWQYLVVDIQWYEPGAKN